MGLTGSIPLLFSKGIGDRGGDRNRGTDVYKAIVDAGMLCSPQLSRVTPPPPSLISYISAPTTTKMLMGNPV